MDTKKFTQVAVLVLIFLVLAFFAGRCSKKDKETVKVPVTIEVAGKSGSSNTITGIKPLPSTGKVNVQYKDSLIEVERPINKELFERYANLSSETERLKEYLKSISENDYKIPFENDTIKIEALIKTRGELLSTKFNYDIKPSTITTTVNVPVKKSVFALYGGAGLSNTITLDNPAASAILGIQNKKGDILSVQYSTDKTIQIGYLFKFLDIKK